MAKTRAVLEARIADDLQRSDLTNQITAAVDDAIQAYEFERFWFNEADQISVTLSTSVNTIQMTALPIKFREIDRIRIRLPGNQSYSEMFPRDYDWLMTRQDVNLAAMPIEYCIYADKLQFDCVANQDYTIVLDGMKDLREGTSLSYSTGSTAVWFGEAEKLIRARAKLELYLHVIQGSERQAATMQGLESKAYAALKSKTNQRGSGRVRPTEF